MLAVHRVHRQNSHALFPRRLHHKLTARHKRFLVGERNLFARFNSGERRQKPRHAHNGVEHGISAFAACAFDHAIHAGEHFGARICHTGTQILRRFFVHNGGQRGVKRPDLLLQHIDTAVGCERANGKTVEPNDIQRLRPDRSSGA